MTIKNDRWIIEQAKLGMIEPFESSQMRDGVVSYGVCFSGVGRARTVKCERPSIPTAFTTTNPARRRMGR